jgi:hypothetical protein
LTSRSSTKTTSPGRTRIRLLDPDLVGVDEHVGHRGEPVPPVLLPPPAGRGVAHDGGPIPRPQLFEVVGQLGVQLAHIPVPEVGQQLVGRRLDQPEQLPHRPRERRLGDPAQVGVPAQARSAQPLEELAGSQPETSFPTAVQVGVGRDLQDPADVERHRPNHHGCSVIP